MSGGREQLVRIAPILPVDNLESAIGYYRDALGFHLRHTHGDPAYYAVVSRDGVAIHLSEREDTSRPIVPVSVYVFVEDVDALHSEYVARRLDIFQPPDDQDTGMREFDVRDSSGHFLTFGERI